ncbi:MAG: SDR family oxidoreductase [Chlorobi bacterium]|nr:SDR family oxidoreductase [Chlorobiota bacterium]
MSAAKVALVTGAGHRLGRHIACGLAENGYDCVVHYHRAKAEAEETARQIRKRKRNVVLVRADLATMDGIATVVGAVREFTEYLHLLVNNAGVFPSAAFEQVTPEIFDHAINVNVRSAFFLSQQLLPLLRNARGSSIINIASAGAYQTWTNHIPYNISKAGLVMLTRALAKTLAPDIRVNAVAPGVIVVPGEPVRKELSPERIPLRRHGLPDDIVKAVLYLAEDACYLTGHVLPVDGGIIDIK